MRSATLSNVKQLRLFGLQMACAFSVLAGIQFWKGRVVGSYLLVGLAVFLLLVALIFPRLLDPLKRFWMALAERLSVVSSFVILVLTFYLVFTPVGTIARLLGLDLLQLKTKRESSSYWSIVDPDPASRPDRPY